MVVGVEEGRGGREGEEGGREGGCVSGGVGVCAYIMSQRAWRAKLAWTLGCGIWRPVSNCARAS